MRESLILASIDEGRVRGVNSQVLHYRVKLYYILVVSVDSGYKRLGLRSLMDSGGFE